MVKKIGDNIMKIALGSDRNGVIDKEKLIEHLCLEGYEILDVGPYNIELPVDYPIYGKKVGEAVASGDCQYGIVICSTGIGISIAANKVKGIRCGMGYADYVAKQMREHIDANVIAFGQDHMDYSDIERRVDIFLNTPFLGAHHCARIQQLADMEDGKDIYPSPILNKEFAKGDNR